MKSASTIRQLMVWSYSSTAGEAGDAPYFPHVLSGSHALFPKSDDDLTHFSLTTSVRPTEGRNSHLSHFHHHQGCVSGDYYAGYGRERQGEKRALPLIMDD